jgi:polysaccharide deacetylase family protein (PEP-CTERM system associated)
LAERQAPSNCSHIATVALEDYFHVGTFNSVIQRGQWNRFESRLEKNAERVLSLLERNDAKATVFVLGWIADRYPELVRRFSDAGHEVASKGYYHRGVRQMTPEEFRDDLLRSKTAIEAATRVTVIGYRLAHEWFQPCDLWALDVLAECGFQYDSSIAPIGRNFADEPWRRFIHQCKTTTGDIWELPISSTNWLGFHVPFAGGNWMRQMPEALTRRCFSQWTKKQTVPAVLYFHAWELDPDQPKLNAPSMLQRMRHYRNLGKMEGRLDRLLSQYRFTSAAEHLGVELAPSRIIKKAELGRIPELASRTGRKTAVSIVAPCFNEELALPYLANTLEGVREKLAGQYDLQFVLVDDGSSDRTWPSMEKIFGKSADVKLVRHEVNRGVAAAILTGIRAADADVVCSIDCDCTYDPLELERMIPLLTADAAMVTASPYHPQGGVRNVPGWRLVLSRGASWLYRRTLRQKLSTYTSCFRVYRKSAVAEMKIDEPGFLGVAEILGRVDLAGGRIVEFPAVLDSRIIGRSKMKTVRTILGHLKLLSKLAWLRWKSPPPGETDDDAALPRTDESLVRAKTARA